MDKRLAALAVSAAGMHDPVDWGMWLGPLVMMALVLSIAVPVALARWMGGDRGGRVQMASNILDERFARGDIDREEYPRPRRYCRPLITSV